MLGTLGLDWGDHWLVFQLSRHVYVYELTSALALAAFGALLVRDFLPFILASPLNLDDRCTMCFLSPLTKR